MDEDKGLPKSIWRSCSIGFESDERSAWTAREVHEYLDRRGPRNSQRYALLIKEFINKVADDSNKKCVDKGKMKISILDVKSSLKVAALSCRSSDLRII